MQMKLSKVEWLWLLIIITIFVLLSLFFVGTELRNGDYDFETDLTLMRYLKGDPWSLLVSNRSPVPQYSIPYGGWPPLQTLIQATWLFFGIPLDYSRLLTGMLIIIAFGFAGVFLAKRIFPQADLILIFMFALLSPIALLNMSVSTRHILIPLAAVIALLSLIHYRKTKFPGIFIIVGFFLGLTDWNAYSILPAVLLYLILTIKFPTLSRDIDLKKLFKWLIYSSFGYLTAFLIFKIITIYVIRNSPNIISVIPGITLNKLIARSISNPINYIYSILLYVIRIIVTFIPIIILYVILKITRWGKLSKDYPNHNNALMIIIVSFMAPTIYYLIFPGHAGIASAIYQALVFLPPGIILLCAVYIKDHYKDAVRSIFLIILSLLSLFSLRGQVLLPDYLVEFVSYPPHVSPLSPGNYDFSPKGKEYDYRAFLRLVVKQMTSLPITHERLTKINSFNKTVENYYKYGGIIGKKVNDDDIIIIFSPGSMVYSYYLKKLVITVENVNEMKTLIFKTSQSIPNAKWVLLIPKNTCRNINYYDGDIKIFHESNIENTPFDLCRFTIGPLGHE